MKRKLVLGTRLAFALLCLLGHRAPAQPGIGGSWQGILDIQGHKLRIVFHIAPPSADPLSATMDSPDQGAQGIPVDVVTFTGGALHLELKAIGGSYDGKMRENGRAVDGTWSQGGLSLPLLLERAEASPPASSQAVPTNAPTAPPAAFRKSTSSDAADILGKWMGRLSLGRTDLHLIVKLAIESSGLLASKLDSPDQGAMDIPVDQTTFEHGHLHLLVKSIGGTLDGDLSEDRKAISATWSQAGVSLPLSLARTDTVITYKRPQEPKPPFPYESREVSYVNPSAGDTLAGTLTLPGSGGPFPAVLLITGSGPENRDEELMGHRPFLVLADYLTRKGIAVLRVDDRGVGKSTGQFRGATSLDFASDALAGVEYLKTVREIDARRIGLIGHSEGGMIGPLVATRSGDVAFLVLMAGPGVRGDVLLRRQQALITKAMGVSDAAIAQNDKIQERVLAVAASSADSADAAVRIRQIIKDGTSRMSDSLRKVMDYDGAPLDGTIRQMLSPWFRYFLAYDPGPTLEKVKCPVLAINGDKDLQVSAEQNLPAITAAFRKGGNREVTVKKLPGLNHLFQTATTGSPMEYAKIEETIAPAALEVIGDWILAHSGGSR